MLAALLGEAGSTVRPEVVVERFRAAQARGEARGAVIPSLFPDEPRFSGPDAARRLYGNLFALWERLAAGAALVPATGGQDEEPAARAAAPCRPLPPRGATGGSILPAELVEAVWKHLDALDPRERERHRHRFEAHQPDLVAWLDAKPMDDAAALVVNDLVFEAWAMLDIAFGERLPTAPFRALREAEEEPPPLQASQPALAAYVAEALDLAAGEDASFAPGAREQIEGILAAVVLVLAPRRAPRAPGRNGIAGPH